ncbi:hypothetical protein [Sphingobacterium haloxyli]|uniref:Uncharacterized protein n=1 Tax=Sphingobacterium haloxyli TaxID=2100533 RepID=A0A2S9J218_9SPHI|nr:hypothetical protein [Sphingobacterium haloxyli]PRD46825.1 hypothetical protein C5745_13240 [Sphingobacterium haloxyli]
MNSLIYPVLAVLALLLIFLLLVNERRKYQRYKRFMDMDVTVQFQESKSSHDQMRHGSVMINLRKSADHIKGIVIKDVAFSHSVFHVPVFDQLYFKGNSDTSQLLSARFRISRHSLHRLEGKQVHIILKGSITDKENEVKPFKARIPYVLQPARRKDDVVY